MGLFDRVLHFFGLRTPADEERIERLAEIGAAYIATEALAVAAKPRRKRVKVERHKGCLVVAEAPPAPRAPKAPAASVNTRARKKLSGPTGARKKSAASTGRKKKSR